MSKLKLGILLTFVLFVSVSMTAGNAFAVWFNPNWGFRQMITIDSLQVPGDLANFPVLVSVTDTDLMLMPNGNVGNADGSDILFTLADAMTQLDHEIESYNPVTGELIAWVEVPNISSTADTIIYMYYGNAGAADQSNMNGTWDEGGSGNYLMVQHLQETTGTHFDSTSNIDSSSVTVTTQGSAPGQINGADEFNGTTDWIEPLSPNHGPLHDGFSVRTVETWFKADTTASQQTFYEEGGSYTGFWMGINSNQIQLTTQDNDTIFNVTASFSDTTSWHHIVGIFNNGTQTLYLDGAQAVSNSAPYGAISSHGNDPGIGATNIQDATDASFGTQGNFFNGIIDEVRISNIDRSPDWIETSYNNQDNPSSFLSFGAPEMFTPVPTITEWGMIIFMVLAGIGSICYLRRRKIAG